METYEEIILNLKNKGKIKVMDAIRSNEIKNVYMEKMKDYRQEFGRKQIQSEKIISKIILNQ